MKNTFTKDEVLKACGCYSQNKAENLIKYLGEQITIDQLMNLPIKIKDKRWFVYNSCELNLQEKKELCLKMAWVVLPIYEEKYPNDSRVKDCLQATEDYLKGLIPIEVLKEKRTYAAYAADSAAYAYAYAAYAADSAAYAADSAAYAAYAAAAYAAAAYAAAYAADAAAKKTTYSERLLQTLIEFVNSKKEE